MQIPFLQYRIVSFFVSIIVSVMKAFTITVPPRGDLCCAIYKIVNCENDPIIYSKFCEDKLKCRQFLQETPEAMAALVANRKLRETGGFMYVIVTRELFGNRTFQNHCNKLNIQMFKISVLTGLRSLKRVNSAQEIIDICSPTSCPSCRCANPVQMDLLDSIPTYIYRACLLHTLEHKLAPRWNKVGLYLVEGEDFLSSSGSVSAITLKIKRIYDNSTVLHVDAVNLKIPFLRLKTSRPLQHDLQPPVRVLPSMKVATVLRVSKLLSSQHVFDDYENLRAYWKNMHGYVLPDYEEGLLFYDLEFFYFKSNVFLYPETCLTSGPLEVLPPPMDPISRIYKFVEELREKVTQLCGQQLDIYSENTYEVPAAITPISSRVYKVSTCDTGYTTDSERIKNTSRFRTPDMCEIPIKRSRLSFSRADKSFTCRTNDFEISPMCSTTEFKFLNPVENIATTCDADSIISDESFIEEDERKSSYFTQEEQEEAKVKSMESADRDTKLGNLTLKEKLLRNF